MHDNKLPHIKEKNHYFVKKSIPFLGQKLSTC